MASRFHSSSDMKRARGLGSAKAGVHHWWLVRVTAVGNFTLLLWFVASLLLLPSLDHATVTAWIAQPLVAIPLVLMILSTFWHARLGFQVFIEDYVHSDGWKLIALTALSFFLLALGAASIFSVLAIAFGAR